MAEFVVKVADERGRLHQQVEHGYSEAEVRDRFSSQGYLVYWVKPQGLLSGGMSFRRGRRLKQSSFLVFNQQFLTLVRAGLPILNSLELLIKRQKDAYLRTILENVRERVRGGELLSDAFAAQGMIPKIYTTTLMAGEKSGNIDEVLTRYINFQRLAMTFRKKLAVSLIYPILLISVVMIMVTFLFTYVVPKFAELFNSLDAKLPEITLFMLAVGQGAQKYAPFVLIGLVITGLLFWRWKNTDGGADRIDRVILSLPLLGEIRLKHQVSAFSRMLSTLLQGGLPLVPALVKLLAVVPAANRNGKVFASKFALQHVWEETCDAAGVEGLLIHDLRRSAVRNMMKAGAQQAEAMKISGHKDASVFQRYNIIDSTQTKGVMAQVAKLVPVKLQKTLPAAK